MKKYINDDAKMQESIELIMRAIRASSQDRTKLLKALQKANDKLTFEKQFKKGA